MSLRLREIKLKEPSEPEALLGLRVELCFDDKPFPGEIIEVVLRDSTGFRVFQVFEHRF